MDEKHRELFKHARSLQSHEAADWIIENTNNGNWDRVYVSRVIASRSWRLKDQFRLAENYLNNLPHAEGTLYQVFLSFMSVKNFASVIRKYIPKEESRRGLLLYYLKFAMEKHLKSKSDLYEYEKLIKEIELLTPENLVTKWKN